jgi:ATP-dependent Lon protease
MAKEIKTENIPVIENNGVLPVLPLKDAVIFPHIVVSLFVGRKSSINAVMQSLGTDKQIFLVTQKNAKDEDIDINKIYKVGIVAKVLQMMRMPDGSLKILAEGQYRAKITNFEKSTAKDKFDIATTEKLPEFNTKSIDVQANHRAILNDFTKMVNLDDKIPNDMVKVIKELDDMERFVNIVISNMDFNIKERQALLESKTLKSIFNKLLPKVKNELKILEAENKINKDTRKQMDENQRDYYLNEKLKSIKKELGAIDDDNEIDELEKLIKKAKMPKEANEKALDELKKLERMSSHSSEYPTTRTYIEELCKMPWNKKSKVSSDLPKAIKVLDKDHCGLEKVKERIIEHLAVQKRNSGNSNNQANILCLVGPPGVGKTSLGKSIARALNRKYTRMALGGVRDEAEIRGHRRTYIGAIPGTIISKIQKVGVKNPLFLLDEIDKMAGDFRGDPASALLEVLDPEQNDSFVDHYMEVEYDLSDVMFVATANSLDMPEALMDRMEIIHLEGYTESEKLDIAKKHLVKKQLSNNGLKNTELKIKDDAIIDIVRYYTREAGVRGLTREIDKIARKSLTKILLENGKTFTVSSKNLKDYLGVKKHRFGLAEIDNQIGQVTGLAWTSVGGDLLTIEATAFKGKGGLNYTGNLKEVMQESIKVAKSVVLSRADKLGIDTDFNSKLDIHIHVPDGATPKDGPSAGAAMTTAMVSVLTGRKVKSDVAMTGEITLRGEITPIGGLKEKLLAALRGGIKTVLIPYENDRELSEVPENIKGGLKIIKVRWLEEVLDIALEKS